MMDEATNKAIESLEISKNQSLVKCQRCNSLLPILKESNLTSSSINRGRIERLQKIIKYAEKYDFCGTSSSSVEKEKEELKDLLEEREKRDILNRIPLYSCHITDYRYVCSKCYDEIYLNKVTLANKA